MMNRPRFVLLIVSLIASSGASSLIAQTLEPAAPIGRGPAPIGFACTAEALNIGGFVGSDGSVAVFNVPADQGRLRLRLTCEDALGSLFGESPLVDLAPGDAALVDEILFEDGTPIASGLRITPADARIEGVGQALQLQVTGDLVDGSTADLAAASTGTTYVSSNPAIASVDSEGRVVLHDSGTVLITASNEGVLGFAQVTGLAAPIASLDITPSPVELVANVLFPAPIEPLTLTATLSDGSQVDLSSAESGTQWQSSAPTVAAVDANGRVFGLSSGIATITATHDGASVEAEVLITEMTPTPVLAIDTPGHAYDLDIQGAMIFVADGPGGLQFFDSSGGAAIPGFDPGAPAYDVRVRDGLAAVAMGVDGIALVDVTDVTAPALLATLSTPRPADDVWLSGDRLVAALGLGGLGVWDVTDPTAPSLSGIRTVSESGSDNWVVAVSADSARGVTVALASTRSLSGVTVDWPSTGFDGRAKSTPPVSLIVFEEHGSVEAWPSTTLPLPFDVAGDVVLWGDTAWVANGQAGLHGIDVGDPSLPFRRVDTSLSFNAEGVAVRQTEDGLLIAAADNISTNAVPFFDGSLRYLADADFSDFPGAVFSNAYSYGVALGDGFGAVAVGRGGIQIFRWQQPVDNGGVAPTVSISSPVDGAMPPSGQPVLVNATAVDDVAVGRVELRLDGEILAVDTSPPYRTTFIAGPDGTEHAVEARAVDLAGNWSAWTPAVTVTSRTDIASACAPVPADLAAWYSFWNTDSRTFWDLAGGPDGEVVVGRAPGTVDGYVSRSELQGSLLLDGDDDYASIPDHPAIDFGVDDFTIELWVKAGDSAGGQMVILSKDSSDQTSMSGYLLTIRDRVVTLQMRAGGALNYFGPELSTNVWHHVAVTVDRDDSQGGRFYLDGELATTFDPTSRPGNMDSEVPLTLGKRPNSVTQSNFEGELDELSIFSRALLAEEIFSIFAAGESGKCLP